MVMRPTKRHGLAGWIEKQDPYICCLYAVSDLGALKVRGWEKVFYVNGNQKKAGVEILISDKVDFKTKTML